MMTYLYTLDDVLNILTSRGSSLIPKPGIHQKSTEYGLLSVGLKIHFHHGGLSGIISEIEARVRRKILQNLYQQRQAINCLVIPPVGSARFAVYLLELFGAHTGISFFNNQKYQVQVCSPGRLSPESSSMLAIAFYLGSDILRRYDLEGLATTYTESCWAPRGKRLVLYDANGNFEHFEWWAPDEKCGLTVDLHFPFEKGRTDLLVGNVTRLDIENINLVATLLTHYEYNGYWASLGYRFADRMYDLLGRHQLIHLLEIPWVHSESTDDFGDEAFFAGYNELSSYVLEEASQPHSSWKFWQRRKERPMGILVEMQELLTTCRQELLEQAYNANN